MIIADKICGYVYDDYYPNLKSQDENAIGESNVCKI